MFPLAWSCGMVRIMPVQSAPAVTTKLINALYIEAMVLADEARAYFDLHSRESRNQMTPLQRVGFSCESLKVTTRLMHVIAWLFYRINGRLPRCLRRFPCRRLLITTDEADQRHCHESQDIPLVSIHTVNSL